MLIWTYKWKQIIYELGFRYCYPKTPLENMGEMVETWTKRLRMLRRYICQLVLQYPTTSKSIETSRLPLYDKIATYPLTTTRIFPIEMMEKFESQDPTSDPAFLIPDGAIHNCPLISNIGAGPLDCFPRVTFL